jgi:hypothetical protein
VKRHRGGETKELGAFNGGEVEATRSSMRGNETEALCWDARRRRRCELGYSRVSGSEETLAH